MCRAANRQKDRQTNNNDYISTSAEVTKRCVHTTTIMEAITNFTASVNNYTLVEAMRKWKFNAKVLRIINSR